MSNKTHICKYMLQCSKEIERKTNFFASLFAETEISSVEENTDPPWHVCYHSGAHWAGVGTTHLVRGGARLHGQSHGGQHQSGNLFLLYFKPMSLFVSQPFFSSVRNGLHILYLCVFAERLAFCSSVPCHVVYQLLL